MTDHPEHLQAESERALGRLMRRHPYLVMDVNWPTALSVLSGLQLALRHPDWSGDCRDLCRGFVDALIAKIGESEPRLAELLRMGDDPAHDQPR